MLNYDRYSWWITVFSYHGTVLPNTLARVGILTIFSIVVCGLNDLSMMYYGIHLPALDSLGHNVLGMSLGLLIVFRTNSSSNRYWEGRSHWGMMVNTCRSLARMGYVFTDSSHARDLANLLTAYVVAVKENLRGTKNYGVLSGLMSGRLFDTMVRANNPPSIIARAVTEWIRKGLKDGLYEAQIASRMEEQVCKLLDAQGGCEKILKTPLPYVYSSLIKQLVTLYVFSLPFVLATKMDWASPVVIAAVGFGMFGIEEAGVEIENPFGLQVNDLPLEAICETIALDVNNLADDPK
ncbi:MAG: bestrophin family protein [Gemmataceae bacterium]